METTTTPQRFLDPEGYGNFSTPLPNLAAHGALSDHTASQLLLPQPDHRPLPSPEASPPLLATPKPGPRRKPDHTAATTTPPCTECGKRFSSWKALFGHMRCHPERQWRGINPPPRFRRPLLLPPPPHAEFTDNEYDVAASLIMLANGPPRRDDATPAIAAIRSLSSGYRFKCTSCGRVFGSQQAHGRHRASHRSAGEMVRCDAGRDGGSQKRAWEEAMGAVGCGHRCNVCCKGFSSGQALGGHMRCHWEKGEEHVGSCSNPNGYLLDLNLPPPVESNEGYCAIPSSALDLKLGWL